MLPSEFIEQLQQNGQNGILIIWDIDDREGCNMHYTDNLTLINANKMILKYAAQIMLEMHDMEGYDDFLQTFLESVR